MSVWVWEDAACLKKSGSDMRDACFGMRIRIKGLVKKALRSEKGSVIRGERGEGVS